MKRILLITQLFFLFSLIACGQKKTAEQKPAEKKEVTAFYLGHSLSDGIPELLWGLTRDVPNVFYDYGYQRINGTPLRHQWNQLLRNTNPEYMDFTDKEMLKVFDSTIVWEDAHMYRFFNEKNGLPSGKYSHLVMTESVPRYIAEGWGNIEDTYRYVDSFYNYAKKYNPNVKPYLYEVWHCIKSGTPTGCDHDKDAKPFRERLTADLPMWESVLQQFNSKNPTEKLQLIPVGQAIGNLSDAIDRKEIPGIQSIKELFTDDIHVNDTLRYFNACVHYATLYEQSPEGLANEPNKLNGESFVKLPKDMAALLQKIAWESVKKYKTTRN